jgi:hypothetical protein
VTAERGKVSFDQKALPDKIFVNRNRFGQSTDMPGKTGGFANILKI